MLKYLTIFIIIIFIKTAKCIDKYIALRRLQHDDSFASPAAKNTVDIDKRLEDIVERMFKRCYGDAQFKQVIKMRGQIRLPFL